MTNFTQSVFSRYAGTSEAFFRRLQGVGARANKEHVSCFVVLQVRAPSLEGGKASDQLARSIRAAWKQLWVRFQGLRTEMSTPSANITNRPVLSLSISGQDEEAFAHSFRIDESYTTVDDLFRGPHIRKHKTALCYWLPTPSQVVIWAEHWRSDGIGLLMLANSFMETLATLVGQEQSRIGESNDFLGDKKDILSCVAPSPSLESAIDASAKDLAEKTDAAQVDRHAHDLSQILASCKNRIRIPIRDNSGSAAPTWSSRLAIRLSDKNTETLTQACRVRGISVTSAVNAAIIHATARYPQSEEAADVKTAPDSYSYAMYAPIDLRRYLVPAGVQECAQPAGNYVSGLPLRIDDVLKRSAAGGYDLGKSFTVLARELGDFYSQDPLRFVRPGDAAAQPINLLQISKRYKEKIAELFAGFPTPGCPFPQTPVISSLGKMDDVLRHEYSSSSMSQAPRKVFLDDFWIGSENASPFIVFSLWSWRGRLTLCAGRNESYYSEEQVRDAFEKMVLELCHGLDIQPFAYHVVRGCQELESTATVTTTVLSCRGGKWSSLVPGFIWPEKQIWSAFQAISRLFARLLHEPGAVGRTMSWPPPNSNTYNTPD